MNLITSITDAYVQQLKQVLNDGTSFNLDIQWVQQQQGWFINSLVYGTFTLTGLRICNNPNMLYQWQNILPFGLACFSTGNREPSLQEDFASGASQLFVLTTTEVANYKAYIQGTGTLV